MTQAGILRHLVNQAVMRRGLPPLPAPSPLSYAELEEAAANAEQVPAGTSLTMQCSFDVGNRQRMASISLATVTQSPCCLCTLLGPCFLTSRAAALFIDREAACC